jgi:hypothetical protein
MALQPIFETCPFLYWGYLIAHTVGLLWTSDQSVTEVSTYTGQHNIQTQEKNIDAPSRIGTRDPSNQAAKTYALDLAATGIVS